MGNSKQHKRRRTTKRKGKQDRRRENQHQSHNPRKETTPTRSSKQTPRKRKKRAGKAERLSVNRPQVQDVCRGPKGSNKAVTGELPSVGGQPVRCSNAIKDVTSRLARQRNSQTLNPVLSLRWVKSSSAARPRASSSGHACVGAPC